MIVERLAQILDQLGAEWLLYLLLFLSITSVALVIERILFFRRNAVPVAKLQQSLLKALGDGRDEAAKVLEPYEGMEAQVALAGVEEMHRGAAATEEVMAARAAVEKLRYERFLGFLGSLGANAPFIGLLGTVIGIMGAFADLKQSMGGEVDANRTQAIMGSISEALVATAVGLIVAIPAVWAYNQLKGRIKVVQGNTAALGSIVLAHVKSTGPETQTLDSDQG
ncbi:MAG TPA: MotA/TolQ/ExbB proton channel family protein [Myxococcales bacterium]|nr:MotA/TolQ/ExbB proton channel family protein [Myxococcales bacterium]